MRPLLVLVVLALFCRAGLAQTTQPMTDQTHVPLVFSGGHETDPRDGGRPVILVASGLGVPAEVFREVFKNVHPAKRGGGPTGDEARANKKVLLDGLSKYGVTNDRLDEVSNRYRYRPQGGELWKHKEAEGFAVVRDGKVTNVTITEPGTGYSSLPSVSVKGVDAKLTAKVAYTTDLEKNGSIESVSLGKP